MKRRFRYRLLLIPLLLGVVISAIGSWGVYKAWTTKEIRRLEREVIKARDDFVRETATIDINDDAETIRVTEKLARRLKSLNARFEKLTGEKDYIQSHLEKFTPSLK